MADPGKALDDGIAAAKVALRREVLIRRDALGVPVRAAASAAIRRQLAGLPALQTARAVLAYAAFGSEVDLDTYLQTLAEEGRGVFLPFLDGDHLGIARVRDLVADVEPGRWGIREPRAATRRPARPDRLDAVITPGVAFDRAGGRLGYGRAYFDRLLTKLRPGTPVVAVAFATQVVDAVPRHPHDVPVDAVVTEDGVHWRSD